MFRNKKYFRLIKLLLCSVLTVTVFSGCTSDKPVISDSSRVTVTNGSSDTTTTENVSGVAATTVLETTSGSSMVNSNTISSSINSGLPISTAFVFPSLVGNNMVLQRNATVKLWGKYNKEGAITVRLNNKAYVGSCKNGKWTVSVNTGGAGGPFDITVESKTEKAILKNVLIGDVYLCSGQSNMLFQVGVLNNSSLGKTVNSNIRLFHVPVNPLHAVTDDISASWAECKADGNLDNFSAVGFIFGKTLQEKLKVPIGLIQSCEGDTILASWLPEQDAKTIEKNYQFNDYLKRRVASNMYNGMINPLKNYSFKGVLWYQGENQPYKYDEWLTLMIKAWRREFSNSSLGFTVVQLPRWGGDVTGSWFQVREKQKKVALALPNCTYSVNIDCGEMDNIHPQDKLPIGVRAAQATLLKFYNDTSYAKSPVYKSFSVSGNRILVEFNNVGTGLELKNGGKGFEVKNSSGSYVSATAQLQGNTLILTATGVTAPTGARYGYEGYLNFPDISLFSKTGLPAEQFEIAK